MASVVCIRRKHQSFYIFVEPLQHSVQYLKEQVRIALRGVPKNDNNTNYNSNNHDNDDDDDDNDNIVDLCPLEDMKLMTTTGKELLHAEDMASLVNEQELHLVYRIAENEYEPVQIQYPHMED